MAVLNDGGIESLRGSALVWTWTTSPTPLLCCGELMQPRENSVSSPSVSIPGQLAPQTLDCMGGSLCLIGSCSHQPGTLVTQQIGTRCRADNEIAEQVLAWGLGLGGESYFPIWLAAKAKTEGARGQRATGQEQEHPCGATLKLTLG